MANKKEDVTVNLEEILEQTEASEEEVVEVLQSLQSWQQTTFIISLANGVKEKYHEMLEDQGNGKIKNNAENRGYLKALKDIYGSLLQLLPPEAITTAGPDEGIKEN